MSYFSRQTASRRALLVSMAAAFLASLLVLSVHACEHAGQVLAQQHDCVCSPLLDLAGVSVFPLLLRRRFLVRDQLPVLPVTPFAATARNARSPPAYVVC